MRRSELLKIHATRRYMRGANHITLCNQIERERVTDDLNRVTCKDCRRLFGGLSDRAKKNRIKKMISHS